MVLWINFGDYDDPFGSKVGLEFKCYIGRRGSWGAARKQNTHNFVVEVIFRHFNLFARLQCVNLLLWVRPLTILLLMKGLKAHMLIWIFHISCTVSIS